MNRPGLANQIQQLETQLATTKNTYLVLGAKRICNYINTVSRENHEAVAEVVPEASGD